MRRSVQHGQLPQSRSFELFVSAEQQADSVAQHLDFVQPETEKVEQQAASAAQSSCSNSDKIAAEQTSILSANRISGNCIVAAFYRSFLATGGKGSRAGFKSVAGDSLLEENYDAVMESNITHRKVTSTQTRHIHHVAS